MQLSEIILEEFTNEMKTTLRCFEALNNEIFDFKPHEKSKSVRQLADHMSHIPSWVPTMLANSVLDWAAYTPPKEIGDKEELIENYKQYITTASEALSKSDDTLLEEEWTMKNGDFTLFTIPKSMVMRNLIINHTIHHRAQMGVYLRLNNLKVPASYVASADENLFL